MKGSGSATGLSAVWRSMRDVIESQVSPSSPCQRVDRIICVGYSHGAALAALTEDMTFLHGDRLSVRGLGGCPRVFWGPLPDSVKNGSTTSR